MRIAVCVTYTLDWFSLMSVTLESLEKYCSKHGYELSANEYVQYGQYTGKDKLREIKNCLLENDVVLSLDADTLITNHTIKVEDFIDDEHDFFISKDYNGLNAGVFIIKKSTWSFAFLDYINAISGTTEIHCEQDAINAFIKRFGAEKIKFIPQEKLNSYLYELYPEIGKLSYEQGQWQTGSFVLHLPAKSLTERIEIFKNRLNDIVYE